MKALWVEYCSIPGDEYSVGLVLLYSLWLCYCSIFESCVVLLLVVYSMWIRDDHHIFSTPPRAVRHVQVNVINTLTRWRLPVISGSSRPTLVTVMGTRDFTPSFPKITNVFLLFCFEPGDKLYF